MFVLLFHILRKQNICIYIIYIFRIPNIIILQNFRKINSQHDDVVVCAYHVCYALLEFCLVSLLFLPSHRYQMFDRIASKSHHFAVIAVVYRKVR